MPDVKRTVKIITEQHVIGKPSGVEGFPMRTWNIRLALVNEHTGEDVPATIFDKATYKLHPTFGDRETQGMSLSQIPYMDNNAKSDFLIK
ncbi:MAG: hypothetical protein Q9220_005346 [cf. Caloplaca sp. 1 TL-2023]